MEEIICIRYFSSPSGYYYKYYSKNDFDKISYVYDIATKSFPDEFYYLYCSWDEIDLNCKSEKPKHPDPCVIYERLIKNGLKRYSNIPKFKTYINTYYNCDIGNYNELSLRILHQDDRHIIDKKIIELQDAEGRIFMNKINSRIELKKNPIEYQKFKNDIIIKKKQLALDDFNALIENYKIKYDNKLKYKQYLLDKERKIEEIKKTIYNRELTIKIDKYNKSKELHDKTKELRENNKKIIEEKAREAGLHVSIRDDIYDNYKRLEKGLNDEIYIPIESIENAYNKKYGSKIEYISEYKLDLKFINHYKIKYNDDPFNLEITHEYLNVNNIKLDTVLTLDNIIIDEKNINFDEDINKPINEFGYEPIYLYFCDVKLINKFLANDTYVFDNCKIEYLAENIEDVYKDNTLKINTFFSDHTFNELVIDNCIFNFIDYYDNMINNVKIDTIDLSSANYSSLSYNNMKLKNVSSNSIAKNLKYINLSNNQLIELPDINTRHYKIHLTASYNYIECVNEFSQPNILSLDLSFNKLKSFPINYNLSSCKYLDLSNNELEEFTLSYACLPSILDLHKNKISKLNIKRNSYINKLDVSYNNLEYLDITDYDIVNCQYNKLNNISLNDEMKYLNCSNNLLTSIPHDKIETLVCYNNNLELIPNIIQEHTMSFFDQKVDLNNIEKYNIYNFNGIVQKDKAAKYFDTLDENKVICPICSKIIEKKELVNMLSVNYNITNFCCYNDKINEIIAKYLNKKF